MTSGEIRELARGCGFELAGVAAVGASGVPEADRSRYAAWVSAGFAGEMAYLEGRRAEVRADPRLLLPSARSIVCVGKLYNTPWPYSACYTQPELAWIARYAWGEDYHPVLRRGLKRLAALLAKRAGIAFEFRIAIDTAPLLERTFAHRAGLGWIGKNTCLINQPLGSWFFLGELLVSLDLEPDSPPPDRCGSCRRCIDACPTSAIVPSPDGAGYAVDSRLCISYFTIELRGAIPEVLRAGIGGHVFGCDICQDVCPWNRKAPVTADSVFEPRPEGPPPAPPLARLAEIDEAAFHALFRSTPVTRARYSGFLRNVAVAMGNRGLPEFRLPLERLAQSEDAVIAGHAQWALERVG